MFLTATAAANMVGNILQVVSGTNFTTGFFEILSVVVGVSVTVDRNICSGVGSAGVINIGGCLDTIAIYLANNTPGNIGYAKSTADYSISSGLTMTADDLTKVTRLVGYTATRGDRGRATIKATANITGLTMSGSGGSFENFTLDANGNTGLGINCTATYMLNISNCKIMGWTANGITVAGGVNGIGIFGCEITGCSGTYAVNFGMVGGVMYGCSVHDNSVPGINSVGASSIIRCLVANNTGASSDGIRIDLVACIVGCTIHGNGRDGIRSPNYGIQSMISGNILTNNGGFGINWPIAYVQEIVCFNVFGGGASANTSGARLNILPGRGDVTLTGDPYVNAGTDFSLNNTAGAGAACRAAGFPGVMLFGGTGYLDIGTLQHQDSGGGGGGVCVPTNVFGAAGVLVG